MSRSLFYLYYFNIPILLSTVYGFTKTIAKSKKLKQSKYVEVNWI